MDSIEYLYLTIWPFSRTRSPRPFGLFCPRIMLPIYNTRYPCPGGLAPHGLRRQTLKLASDTKPWRPCAPRPEASDWRQTQNPQSLAPLGLRRQTPKTFQATRATGLSRPRPHQPWFQEQGNLVTRNQGLQGLFPGNKSWVPGSGTQEPGLGTWPWKPGNQVPGTRPPAAPAPGPGTRRRPGQGQGTGNPRPGGRDNTWSGIQ